MKRIAMGNDSGCEGLPGDLVPLEEFDYTNERVGCILRQGFAEVNFLGITVSCYVFLYIKQWIEFESINLLSNHSYFIIIILVLRVYM